MEIFNEHQGTIGWGILAAYVVAWDIFAKETLSSAADRALDHQYMKWVAWGIGGMVTGHVLNLLPEKIDLVQQTGNLAVKAWEKLT